MVHCVTFWYVMLLYGTLWYFIAPMGSLWLWFMVLFVLFSTWTNMFQILNLPMTKLTEKYHLFHKIEIFYHIWSANNSFRA